MKRILSSAMLGIVYLTCTLLLSSSICQGSLVHRKDSQSRIPYQIVQNWDTDPVVAALAPSETSYPSHVVRKRDTSNAIANNSTDTSSKVKSSVVHMNDSHTQLLVHWAGQDVILCLAKNINSNSSSTLWISRDYGGNFSDATSLLVHGGGSSVVQPVLEGFFNHPSLNGHFAFTDIQNKYLFTTKNYGAEFSATKLEFVPDEVLFDPHSDVNIVAHEKSTTNKEMWVSVDFGATWSKVQDHVKSLSWDELAMPADLYLQREEPGPGDRSIILKSDSLFLDAKSTEVIITGVEEFEIKDDFMFATKPKENGTYELWISYRKSEFRKAVFPSSQITKHFFIADVSADGQIFVCVVQNESVSNLYIGSFPLSQEENPKFTLSLERILYFKPNVTWSESWINDVSSEPFVDLHAVEGLRGVYIASQLKPSTVSSGKFNMNEVVSVITFDQGAEWKVLNPPEFEHDGRPIYCQYKAVSNCSLHISQRLNELYPRTRGVPIMSKKSAVGLVIATGTVNTTLKGHLGVYLSTDGAVSWRQILQGNYLYAFGDHGGIIVATKLYKIGGATNELIYSIDEGETWEKYQFYDEKVRVMGLMTETGENTTVFFIFGSSNTNTTNHTWALIKVDFRDVFERNCVKEDYKPWSPWDSKPDRPCLLGRKEIYERRIPTHRCYNGQDYVRPATNKTCACNRADFECDFGYVEDSKTNGKDCVKDNSEASPGVKAEWCKPLEKFYNKTHGYRKIPGDTCEEGEWSLKYLPETIPCEVKEEPEFLLVAKRDSVIRIDLNHFERIETLPLTGVAAVIAVDFNLKNNCIYWSDVQHKTIMRLHLDGKSTPEVLLSTDVVSVEGLAFDWMSNNLYFTDGGGGKIEVLRVDGMGATFQRRMRKRLLTKPDVEKPRGIAVHPEKGYIFWTDWSNQNPCIGRSHLDGSNVTKIITNNNQGRSGPLSVKWPNGITIDLNKNRIYWVDANLDRMMSADLNGNDYKIVLEKEDKISHPFAVGIYKNTVYWDDWTTRGIYYAPADNVNKDSIFLIQGQLPRLMDLKVYGTGMQGGDNACTNSNCSHLCMMSPSQTASCICADGFVRQNNSCICPDGKPPNANGGCESKCEDGKTFQCKSHPNYCIINAWRCDGENDCGDGSDEEECDTAVCSDPAEFKCKISGRCIPRSFICDYDQDCGAGDTSDEEHCESQNPCDSQKHFQCGNGRCILKSWKCDGDDDCMDGSDEKNCTDTATPGTFTCLPSEVQCRNESKCISPDWICDFEFDCEQKSDEENCTSRQCPEWKFSCGSGHCIMKTWECDGDKDCPDGSDEHAGCPAVPVSPEPISPFPQGNCSTMSQMFECLGSKDCIVIYWKCDGVKDCADGSDELGCKNTDDNATTITIEPSRSQCELDHWRCADGTCIASLSVCDSFPDCPSREDEANCLNATTGECPPNSKRCGNSKACIPNLKWCNSYTDCPNGADERECAVPAAKEKCNSGSFSCDDNMCLPLFKKCDGKADCVDEMDEDPELCRNFAKVYQVDGLLVTEVDSTWFEIEWWLPKLETKKVEFIVEVCELESSHCWNSTVQARSYKIGGEGSKEKLAPYKKYTVTVYVTDGGKTFPPSVYTNVTTSEAESSPPFGVDIRQNSTEDLIVSWKKPHTPNGKIQLYKVFFQPPLPPAKIESDGESVIISNKQSDPVFLPGVNYSFWVVAVNGHGDGRSSDVQNYVYNGEVAIIGKLKIDDLTENTVKFTWEPANGNVDNYAVILETDMPSSVYKFRNLTETDQKSVEFRRLASGTKHKVTVIPKYQGMHGSHRSIAFATKGSQLSKVKSLKGTPVPGGIVTLSWKAVDTPGATYGIYYGKTVAEMAEKRDQITTGFTQAQVSNLEACENYLFDIGLVTSTGYGPLTESPIQVLTKMNPTSPPKALHVEQADGEARVKVTWKAPCDVMEKAQGYNITIVETTHNRTYGVGNVSYSNHPSLSHMLTLQYGGSYQLTVASNVESGKPSAAVYFEGPTIPFPEQIQECSQCSPLAIYWIPPKLPKLMTKKGRESYVVWLSKDLNFTDPKRYETTDHSFKFEDVLDDGIYYAAVSVMDAEGLESPRSSPIIVQQTGASSPIVVIPGSSALAITITVMIVIVLLVAVLGIFVVRHKRLQTSFLNFASSHYSSHSGAATFQQNVEEQDSPVIRGFSDDEPLLVA